MLPLEALLEGADKVLDLRKTTMTSFYSFTFQEGLRELKRPCARCVLGEFRDTHYPLDQAQKFSAPHLPHIIAWQANKKINFVKLLTVTTNIKRFGERMSVQAKGSFHLSVKSD